MQDTLQFYAFSANKEAGDGVGDVVADRAEYKELNAIPHWRRMFSSFWAEDPLEFRGKTYLSFEHAMQAAKYRVNGHDEIADRFTHDSLHVFSRMTGIAVKRAGRQVRLTEEEVKRWDETMRDTKDAIYRAKFTPESRPGKALLATKKAQLVNAGPRIKRIRCARLEALREELPRT